MRVCWSELGVRTGLVCWEGIPLGLNKAAPASVYVGFLARYLYWE
jgi:hypothetical protein